MAVMNLSGKEEVVINSVREKLTSNVQRHRAIISTVCSTKGGVGKTTCTANLGGLLADLEQKTLLVDFDPQPTLSSYYALDYLAPKGLVEFLTNGELESVISHTAIGCDILISNDPDNTLSNWVLHQPDGRTRLRRLLLSLAPHYDHILIDCQGATGPIQDAGVLAGDVLLSPIPPEILSAREFARGTLRMLDRLAVMEAQLGYRLGHLYGFINRMDRTIDARETAEVIREFSQTSQRASPGRISILNTSLPTRVAFREAQTAQLPIHRYKAEFIPAMLSLLGELPLEMEGITAQAEAIIRAKRYTSLG